MASNPRTPEKEAAGGAATVDPMGAMPEALAQQASGLYRPARRHGQQSKAELYALNAIAGALRASLKLQAMIEQTLAVLLSTLHCASASILLLDWETQELEVYVGRRSEDRPVFAFRRFDLLALPLANVAPGAPSLVVQCVEEAGRAALLSAPISAEGQVLGMLAMTLDAAPPRSNAPQQCLLRSIGSAMGQAIRNARLYERTQREADLQAAVNAIGTAIGKSLGLPHWLDDALQQLLAVTDLHFGAVLLRDDDPASLSIVASSGVSAQGAARLAAHVQSLAARLANEPIIEEDLPAEPQASEAPRCLMYIALRPQSECLGFLTVGSYTQRHFAPGASDLLVGIAGQISLALQNRRLYEETQRSAQRLEAISAVASAGNQTLEIDRFLHTALAQVVEAADLRGASVLLLAPEQLCLNQIAFAGHGDLGAEAIPLGAGGAGRAAAERRAVVEEAPGSRGREYWYYLPLESRGRLLGVLAARGRGPRLAPTTADLLPALAGQVAMGLSNALLYGEALERAAALAQANEALRAAVRGKDQFLANVTHELKRPLAPARLVLETLIEAPAGRFSAQRRQEMLRIALHNIDNLNALVSELLDAVRLERNDQLLAQEAVDLRGVARRSLAAMSPLAEAHQLQVHTIIPAYPVNVRGDAAALERVVTNLLSNACKFNRSGGSILLQVERTSDGKAVLAVTDTGLGIPAHAREHIFERFYQADGSSTRAHEGLGLGLYIAREIVEHHRGQIHFESEENEGTTFTVILPIAED